MGRTSIPCSEEVRNQLADVKPEEEMTWDEFLSLLLTGFFHIPEYQRHRLERIGEPDEPLHETIDELLQHYDYVVNSQIDPQFRDEGPDEGDTTPEATGVPIGDVVEQVEQLQRQVDEISATLPRDVAEEIESRHRH